MITGFNTDVEHDGVIYHVQTEDKGLNSPLILSLVYAGGAILASKRAPYDDLLQAGFNERALAERLQRQHKLICAAIHAGRIEDLKRMGHSDARESAPKYTDEEVLAAPGVTPEAPFTGKAVPPEATPLETKPPVIPAPENVPTHKPAKVNFTGEEIEDEALQVSLLEEREFRAGEFVTLRVRVSSGPVENRDAVPDAPVTMKIMGTSFRPLVCSARTDRDGIAIVFAALPRFTTGRAAILIHVDADGHGADLRRIIHPA